MMSCQTAHLRVVILHHGMTWKIKNYTVDQSSLYRPTVSKSGGSRTINGEDQRARLSQEYPMCFRLGV